MVGALEQSGDLEQLGANRRGAIPQQDVAAAAEAFRLDRISGDRAQGSRECAAVTRANEACGLTVR
jgi:hypothetical protein